MRCLDKTGIYVDCKKLRRLIQRSQKCMTKADRIIYGTPMLEMCGRVLSDFILAYDFEDERSYYIKKFLSEFYVFKFFMIPRKQRSILIPTTTPNRAHLY